MPSSDKEAAANSALAEGRAAAIAASVGTHHAGVAHFMRVPGAPAPVGPFSHAVEVDGWVFLTGQMPTDPSDDRAPLPDGIEAQTRRVVDNLVLVLNGAGLALEHVVAARVFLTHFARDYDAMNAVYRSCFPEDRLPARTCVGVTGLARGALVEIDFIARRP